jgi:hypothetical protein
MNAYHEWITPMKTSQLSNATSQRNTRSLTALALLATLLLSACSEYIPTSFGALEGIKTATPAVWTQVATTEIIQLETTADTPYSVNLWTVEVNGDLLIFAGDNRTNWVENIERNADVRLRANGLIYELRAIRITNAATFEMFAKAWEAKYGNRPRNENVDETYLFKLTSRTV